MPIDNTLLFMAVVKTVKIRNKALGENNNWNANNSILKKTRKSSFISKSSELTKQITNLRDFVFQHRKAYLNFTPSFVNTDQMTDEERDNIDSNAQQIIKSSTHLINSLRNEVKLAKHKDHSAEVYQAVIELIDNYLKTVCKLITDQMNVRIKWKSELQKISKIDTEKSLSSKGIKDIKDYSLPGSKKSPRYNSGDNLAEDNVLSEEEMQVFELENELLYNDLNSLSDEVIEIQSKVVKIAELQEVFTEKVLEQNEDLERINTTLIGTTENIKDANKQIREAIQNNAGLRIYLLFFLLVMSFSLLFLDWYND